jgi:predicted ATP-dependent serine protease
MMASLIKAECQYCEEITLHINGECSVCGDFYSGMPKQKIKKKKIEEPEDTIKQEKNNALRKQG